MNYNPGVLKGRIYQVIFEHGPMTYEALLRYIPDALIKKIKDCIVNDRFMNKSNGRKVFRVVAYEAHRGTGGSFHPVIGLGNEPDEPPPVVENAHLDASRRYEATKGKVQRERRKREHQQAEQRAALAFAGLLGAAPPKLTNTLPSRVHLIPITAPKPKNGNGKKAAQKNLQPAQASRRPEQDRVERETLS
jgi:hypothetical protein